MTALDPTPEVSGRYGAPMGRMSHNEYTVTDTAPPMYLRRIYLNNGGYDAGGAYWGHGAPLYYYEAHVSDIRGYVRGKTRDAAKTAIKAMHPLARFYR